MDIRRLAEKYEITETLFENGLQSVYQARLIGSPDKGSLLINEFRDVDIIYSMKDSFSPDKCKFVKNLVETFYIDFNFYVVSQMCSGATLKSFLADNSLRLTEKMYIADNLLSQTTEMSSLSPLLQYALCDPDNLNIVNKKKVCFNCNIKLNKDETIISYKELTNRIGRLLCMIFANTVDIELENAADYVPPAMLSIIQRCKDGYYTSVKSLYDDFKALLLYSVFIGNVSIAGQVHRNISKARLKSKLSPVRKAAAALIIIFLIAGAGWWYLNQLDGKIADVTTGVPAAQQNRKPTAKFSLSSNKVYAGDEVVFTSQSTDPDLNDGIKSYLWIISQDRNPVFSSINQSITYKFEQAGKYDINLVVMDKNSEASDPYTLMLEVLPKPQLPEGSPATDGSDDLK